jgi:hypothetical protein
MNKGLTNEFVVVSPHGVVFVPWAGFMFVGAVWGFVVPDEASLRSLARWVRVSRAIGGAFLTATFIVGMAVGQSRAGFWIGLGGATLTYSLVAALRVRTLRRIPPYDSLLAFAGRLGAVRVWESALVSVLCVVLASVLPIHGFESVPIVVLFGLNALLSLCALRLARGTS